MVDFLKRTAHLSLSPILYKTTPFKDRCSLGRGRKSDPQDDIEPKRCLHQMQSVAAMKSTI